MYLKSVPKIHCRIFALVGIFSENINKQLALRNERQSVKRIIRLLSTSILLY